MNQRFSGGVRAGDRAGLGIVYDTEGELICHENESILRRLENWDVDVISPWRRIMPHAVFPGFHGKASSRLVITESRIVLIRDIDEWRELSGELYPLGLPNAAAKEVTLRRLKAEGVRQFCELLTKSLRLVRVREHRKHRSMLELRVLDTDGQQYGILIWNSNDRDDESLSFIRSRFGP